MKSIDFIEGYLPGIPSATKAGIGGWLVYQLLHPKEFYDGVITNYDTIKSVFVDKEKNEQFFYIYWFFNNGYSNFY